MDCQCHDTEMLELVGEMKPPPTASGCPFSMSGRPRPPLAAGEGSKRMSNADGHGQGALSHRPFTVNILCLLLMH